MLSTIDIRPIDETHYYIGLNLHAETYELADISYIMDSLTKCVKHMEYMLEQAEESRKGGKNDK